LSDRLLIVSAVRNEREYIERVARAVAKQTRPPESWIVVDDGSDDGTLELLQALEPEIPFMQVLSAQKEASAAKDRLAVAAEARAWNQGLRAAGQDDFAFVGKLDGDVEIPTEYFETLLAHLAADPQLGIAGGCLLEPRGSKWSLLRIPEHHVHGAVKLYRRSCFDAVGGIEERLAWDTIDETYARMNGFTTRSYPDVLALHHRPAASAGGRLRGSARHGECAHITHYGPVWVILRSVKVAFRKPVVLSGLAFLFGYLRAAIRGTPQVDDKEFRRYVRRELRARMLPIRSFALWGSRRA
jgi:biofilm PGA synthesis N-glycosyltransferase PgaC